MWVTAYYVEVNAKGPQKIKSQVISADLDLENGGWVNLDVTDPVRRWLKKSEAGFETARSNHGLIIQYAPTSLPEVMVFCTIFAAI